MRDLHLANLKTTSPNSTSVQQNIHGVREAKRLWNERKRDDKEPEQLDMVCGPGARHHEAQHAADAVAAQPPGVVVGGGVDPLIPQVDELATQAENELPGYDTCQYGTIKLRFQMCEITF